MMNIDFKILYNKITFKILKLVRIKSNHPKLRIIFSFYNKKSRILEYVCMYASSVPNLVLKFYFWHKRLGCLHYKIGKWWLWISVASIFLFSFIQRIDLVAAQSTPTILHLFQSQPEYYYYLMFLTTWVSLLHNVPKAHTHRK